MQVPVVTVQGHGVARTGHLGAELVRLHQCTRGQIDASEPGGEPQIVFEPRASGGLTIHRDAVEQDRVQAFGGVIDRGGQAGRSSADHDDVEVMVLDVDEERRRISLGMKQTHSNPWEAFAATFKKGDKVHGAIKSITDFGIFVGLEGGIDGLVHLSDISWQGNGEELVREFKKGDEVDAVVLAVDPERERISLGIKQLEQDPFGQYMAAHPRGSVVNGTVKEVDAKGATIELADGVEGYVRVSDIAKERIEDATQHLKVGDKVDAKFIGMDRKGRVLQLSIRAKDDEEMQQALEDYQSASGGTTKLGALLKEQFNKSE